MIQSETKKVMKEVEEVVRAVVICDVCGEKTPIVKNIFGQVYQRYYNVSVWHHDWSNDSKDDSVTVGIEAVTEIPKDYVYDTETDEFFCYRNKYTGNELHIVKEPNTYRLVRPTGQWIIYGRQGGIPITTMCSNCKYEMKWYKNKYKYCPSCGADMRKERKNE